MLGDLDINNIRDLDDALECIRKLFNLVETLNQEILELKRQNQELRDEINRLKGEQGKPKIKQKKKLDAFYFSFFINSAKCLPNSSPFFNSSSVVLPLNSRVSASSHLSGSIIFSKFFLAPPLHP